MKNKILILFALQLIMLTGYSQELFYKDYNWSNLEIPSDVKDEKIYLIKKKVVEFTFEGDNFIEYELTHQAELLNSDKEIEKNNRLYIPYNDNCEVINPKARVIQPSGKIIELDQSKILESVDEKTNKHYKYFAFEGLEKGSIIEYLYVVKGNPSYTGVCFSIQNKYPTKKYEFDLFTPNNLLFAFKLYNDTTQIVRDTVITERNHWSVNLDNIEGVEDEDLAPYKDLIKKIVYKLDRNTYNDQRDISSFGKASQNVYNNFFTLDKDQKKALKKWLKKINLNSQDDVETKIRAIENYVKDNVNVVEAYAPELTNIATIFENKYANERGMALLIASILKGAGVNFQVVLTCDRRNGLFDKEFESFHQLDDYLFYFPETKKYLYPSDMMYRYGVIPSKYTNNYGLFIKEIVVGEFASGVGKVKFIEPIDYKESYHNVIVKANLNIEEGVVNLNVSNQFFGYSALYSQTAFDILKGDDREKFAQENIKALYKQMEPNNWSVENAKVQLVGQKPLVLKFDGTCNSLLETAGNKFLFKIGELIGPQAQMYSDKPRKLPVLNYFKRMYNHSLEFVIPDGYTIKNIDDLKIIQQFKKEGEELCKFESNYELNGNILTVSILEYYNQLYFDVNEYDDSRRVVNAASDFNKVSLILEKM